MGQEAVTEAQGDGVNIDEDISEDGKNETHNGCHGDVGDATKKMVLQKEVSNETNNCVKEVIIYTFVSTTLALEGYRFKCNKIKCWCFIFFNIQTYICLERLSPFVKVTSYILRAKLTNIYIAF